MNLGKKQRGALLGLDGLMAYAREPKPKNIENESLLWVLGQGRLALKAYGSGPG